MNFLDRWFEKAKQVILDPDQFFEEQETSEKILEPLTFLLVSMSLPVLIGWVSDFILRPELTMTTRISTLISIFIMIPVTYIIFSGLVHLFVKLLHQGSFNDTLDAIAYPTAINFFIGWIPIINVIATFYMILSQIKGLQKKQDMVLGKAYLVYILPIITVMLIIVLIAVLTFTSDPTLMEEALRELPLQM